VPFILMGKVLEKKGDYDLAVLALKHAVTMEPNNPTTHYLLGQAYRDMGNKEAADAEVKRSQELHAKDDLQ
jgi:Flp pilus assembly protein TadD